MKKKANFVFTFALVIDCIILLVIWISSFGKTEVASYGEYVVGGFGGYLIMENLLILFYGSVTVAIIISCLLVYQFIKRTKQ